MAEKRDLVFLWIDEGADGIFKGESVNFGSEYVFMVERVGERLKLTAEPDTSYVPDFFSSQDAPGSIANLTAFVGKNATGKTKLTKHIANLIDGWARFEYVSTVRVTDESGAVSFEIFHSHSGGEGEREISAIRRGVEEPDPPSPSLLDFDTNLGRFSLALRCDLGKARAVYYSPITDFSNGDFRKSYPHYVDVSTNNLLLCALEDEMGSWKEFNQYSFLDLARSESFKRQFNLVHSHIGYNELDALKDIDLHLDKLFIVLVRRKHDLEKDTWNIPVVFRAEIANLKKKYDADRMAISARSGGVERGSEAEVKVQQDSVVLYFAYDLMLAFLHNLNRDGSRLRDQNPPEHATNEEFVPSLKHFFEQVKFIESGAFVGSIEIMEKHKGTIRTPDWAGDVVRFEITPDAARDLFINNLSIERLFSGVHYSQDKEGGVGFMKFEWGLTPSSGEKAYMDLWCSLYRAREILEQGMDARQVARKKEWWPDTIYLILDEGELGFHPEWQQKYIRSISRGAPLFFRRTGQQLGAGMSELLDTRIQVIIATHSPISLSDVPLSHTVFLKKEKIGTVTKRWVADASEVKIENTFGANIHDLYRNPFFLTDHTIGHFAFDKIEAVVEDLNGEDVAIVRRNEILHIINLIGEPVIRQRLMQMYEGRYGQSITNEDRIRYHKEQLKRLTGGHTS